MGFLKFRERNSNSNIHWHRADRDGAPFRGAQIPLLRDEEFERFSERVDDCKYATFDTSNPDQKEHGRTYQDVLDGIMAGWFTLLNPRQYRWVNNGNDKPRIFVFIEWSEPYTEISSSKLQQLQGKPTVTENEGKYAIPTATNGDGQPSRSPGEHKNGRRSGFL